MDYIQTSAVDKMTKFLDKGLDPNYQDADTGGKQPEEMSPAMLPFFTFLSVDAAKTSFTAGSAGRNDRIGGKIA